MAVTYYGYKSNAYGASSKATDPYFSYQTVTHSGTQANQTVVSVDACSISNANTNGSSSGGYRMNIEAQINGIWYTLGYISVAKQEASHQTFSNFTPMADASLRSLMGKTPPTALRGKVDAGYFHLNAGSTLQLSATTQMDYTSCTEPAAVSLSAAQSEGNVTLSWSGAQAGSNNAITGYEVQYQESADNSSWSAWKALTTVSTSAASGSLSVAPPATRGYYRRFQLRTMGTAGGSYYSPWKISANSVRRYILSTLSLSPQTVTADESITATLGISHSDLTHKVTIVFGNYSKAQELAAGVSSYTFKVQPDWLSQIPTSLAGTATCTLETRSGSTVIDTRSAAFTIACPASAVPTIGSMSVSPVSDVVPSEWQIYVNGYSKALIQASGIMTGMGANVTEYRIAGGDYTSGKITYTSGIAHTTALINRSGLVDLTLMVYDSRGLNTQKSATVTFVDYSTPAIESFKAYRVNDVGAVDPNGTRIAGDVSYSYNQLSGKNTAMVSINVDNTAVLSNVPLPQGNGIYSFILPATYEISKSFTVKATLKDKLSQQAAGSVVINTSARKINVGGGKNGGVALGKMSEHDKTLELASDWKLRLGQTDIKQAIDGKVSKTGDTMTGNLQIWGDLYPTLYLAPTANGYTGSTALIGATGRTFLRNYSHNQGTQYRELIMYSNGIEPSHSALMLNEYTNGHQVTHRIYHSGMDYTVTYHELTLRIVSGLHLDNARANGKYIVVPAMAGQPSSGGMYGILEVVNLNADGTGSYTVQRLYNVLHPSRHWQRVCTEGAIWTSWYRFEGVAD